MANVQEKEVHEAIRTILSDTKSHPTSLNYAVNYCRLAREMHGEALKIQCLYILNNIAYWRHLKAKAVRQVLKDFTYRLGEKGR